MLASITLFVEKITLLEKKIGYSFKDKELLTRAFTHSSYSNEAKDLTYGSNERLEFLGDAVLGLCVSQTLFELFPKEPEGTLSMVRSALVGANACVSWAKEFGIGEFLVVGKGERLQVGQNRDSLLADLFEALIGALFCDGGMEAVFLFLRKEIKRKAQEIVLQGFYNAKSELQQIVQNECKQSPLYKILRSFGPDHDKEFEVVVFLDEFPLGWGQGRSKKSAEMEAAREACSRIKKAGSLKKLIRKKGSV